MIKRRLDCNTHSIFCLRFPLPLRMIIILNGQYIVHLHRQCERGVICIYLRRNITCIYITLHIFCFPFRSVFCSALVTPPCKGKQPKTVSLSIVSIKSRLARTARKISKCLQIQRKTIQFYNQFWQLLISRKYWGFFLLFEFFFYFSVALFIVMCAISVSI